MEIPAGAYFFALAALSMAFVGFTSVVVVLHHGTGKRLSDFHILLTRVFVELGLMATAFAMLAPTLVLCGLQLDMVWRTSSAIMFLTMIPWLAYYPMRRKAAAPDEKMPLRWYVMTLIGIGAGVFLFLNSAAILVTPGPAPLAITTAYVLSYAAVSYLGTYSLFTRG